MVSRLAFDALAALTLAITALLGELAVGAPTTALAAALPCSQRPCPHSSWAPPLGPGKPKHCTAHLPAGAYTPVCLARRDRLGGGSGRSLAFVLGNMFSAGGCAGRGEGRSGWRAELVAGGVCAALAGAGGRGMCGRSASTEGPTSSGPCLPSPRQG